MILDLDSIAQRAQRQLDGMSINRLCGITC